MFKNMFQIRKISDLTRLCVVPVMIVSIFLSFFLYLDMEKIQDKSQELVNNAIPHVLSTQKRAVNLVHLKRSIELMTTSPDINQARKYYIDVRALLTEASYFQKPHIKEQAREIVKNTTRLWRLRLQLDELRNAVNGSLHFMDGLFYLIFSEHPDLLPELKDEVNNYIDLYKINFYDRDLKAEHEKTYKLIYDRLVSDSASNHVHNVKETQQNFEEFLSSKIDKNKKALKEEHSAVAAAIAANAGLYKLQAESEDNSDVNENNQKDKSHNHHLNMSDIGTDKINDFQRDIEYGSQEPKSIDDLNIEKDLNAELTASAHEYSNYA